ncbi:hypothetical protein CJ030_MR8G002056 [Morella rubra]|uniref:Uncharacterized protein n=1 Tax=Morella rubra TaxID=262757 RepID=A0A6A1URF2_9ROSI|nr:hypothetical protein CJ030_MR8G002056 [Morella rubra]
MMVRTSRGSNAAKVGKVLERRDGHWGPSKGDSYSKGGRGIRQICFFEIPLKLGSYKREVPSLNREERAWVDSLTEAVMPRANTYPLSSLIVMVRDIPEVRVPSSSPVPASPVLGGTPSSSGDLVGASSHFAVLDVPEGDLLDTPFVGPSDAIVLSDFNFAGDSDLHGAGATIKVGLMSRLLPTGFPGIEVPYSEQPSVLGASIASVLRVSGLVLAGGSGLSLVPSAKAKQVAVPTVDEPVSESSEAFDSSLPSPPLIDST